MVTDSSGNDIVPKLRDHFPYGESWYNAAGDKLMFTTYERDAESGNDYAMARYNVSRLGRFSSQDPLPGNISDPQSLNRYSYVRNMPVMLADPSGACPSTVQNTPDGYIEGQGNFVIARFLISDSDSDADPDPQGLGGYAAGGCDNPGAGSGGGGFYLDGGDNTNYSGYGGFALGSSGSIGSGTGGYALDLGDWAPPGWVVAKQVNEWYSPEEWISSWFFVSGDPGGSGGGGGGGGGNDAQKKRDLIKASLAQKNLAKCLNKFFGPGTILTNANLPRIDASNDLPGAGRTDAAQVPDTGRGTVQIDKGIFTSLSANDPYLVGTYLHETANVLAIQLFTNVQPREARPQMGPRGGPPTQDQRTLARWTYGDSDIGNQFEKCIFP